MTDERAQSPKRRHILSSINPDEPPRKRRRRRDRTPEIKESKSKGTAPREEETHNGDDFTKPRRSRLKLKDQTSSPSSSSRRDEKDPSRECHRRHHCRRGRSLSPPGFFGPAPLDRDAAFRESLFDAMADDEGASYWESVYGQPVHVYSNTKSGPEGELERMTDEEYATHVRQKMWEKTHAGLVEERDRKEEDRRRRKKEEKEKRRIQEAVEESLRRGEERRARKNWKTRWEQYNQACLNWDGSLDTMPWPTESGSRNDIDAQKVRAFLILGLDLEEIGEKAFVTKLKEERVRWHPDKIQQRLGGQVDNDTMRDVTAIFQTVDRLWGEMRSKG